MSLQAGVGAAGQGSSPFSFLGSLGKEQASGCNSSLVFSLLQSQPYAWCLMHGFACAFPRWFGRGGCQHEQWWRRASQAEFGGSIPRGTGKLFWLLVTGQGLFLNLGPSAEENLDCRGFLTHALY